jgi:hypothetical protein
MVIDVEVFCDFCRQYTKDVVRNRLAKKRNWISCVALPCRPATRNSYPCATARKNYVRMKRK